MGGETKNNIYVYIHIYTKHSKNNSNKANIQINNNNKSKYNKYNSSKSKITHNIFNMYIYI